jgi:hypothetical protein
LGFLQINQETIDSTKIDEDDDKSIGLGFNPFKTMKA